MAIREPAAPPPDGATRVAAMLASSVSAERQASIRRRLRWQMAVAGLSILFLLLALRVLDGLDQSDQEMAGSTLFTEPVPVGKARPGKAAAAPVEPASELPALVASPVVVPVVVPVVAAPQASGAAIEPPLPIAEAPSATVGEARHALQSSALPDRRRAEELQAKLSQQGIPARLETRLQVGPFASRAEAEAARRKVQALGVELELLPDSDRRP
jgi:cell division septation protein DedD